jgi:hypothetical protein
MIVDEASHVHIMKFLPLHTNRYVVWRHFSCEPSIYDLVVFNDIRAVNMTACWYHLLFQFSLVHNFEFPNLAIYLDAAN